MHKVIVLDDLAQEGLDLLDQADGFEYEVRTGLKGDQLKTALNQFDGAICRSGVQLNASVLEDNRRLKAIVRTSERLLADGEASLLKSLCTSFENFVIDLHVHENQEADLLLSFFDDDVGVGD